MSDVKEEYLHKKSKSKDTYYYRDTEKKIDVISREVFKNKDEIIHYHRGFEDKDKYEHIKKFRYIGFKEEKGLPVGIVKSVSYGWGFTSALNPFAYYMDDVYSISEVIVEKKGLVELDTKSKKLRLNEQSLALLQKSFSVIYKY